MFKKILGFFAAATLVVSPALAQDRTFVTNPPTTSGAGLTYNPGTDTITATGADGARIYSTTRPIEQGKTYKYEFTISSYTAGGIQPYIGSIRESWTGPTIPAPVSAATNPLSPGRIPIPDTFPTGLGLQADGPSSLSADPVGAYRMHCEAGPVKSIDPMLVPGKDGGSHLHQFFGNTGVTAWSTYKSLRTTGGSTCGTNQLYPVWRSAYWAPAMLNGVGGVVTLQSINVYYKRAPSSSLDCTGPETGTGYCVRLPNGLQIIWGYNMQTMQPDPTVNWTCRTLLDVDTGASTGGVNYANLKLLREAPGGCPIGNRVVVNSAAPACWDGINIATPNFRDHVKHATGSGQFFHGKCPTSHPYHFPEISLQIAYNVDSNLNTWRLSSDDQMGMGVVAGETFHTDMWEAVSPEFKTQWQDNCIEMQLSCSVGSQGVNARIMASRNLSVGKSRIIPANRQGFGLIRRKTGTFRGEFTAPADGEFGLSTLLFTGVVTGYKVTEVTKGRSGPVTITTTK